MFHRLVSEVVEQRQIVEILLGAGANAFLQKSLQNKPRRLLLLVVAIFHPEQGVRQSIFGE